MANKRNGHHRRKSTKASNKQKAQRSEAVYSARGIFNYQNLQGNHTFASSSSLQQDDGLDMPGGEDLSPHVQDAGDVQDDGHDRSLTPYCCRVSCFGD
jgi:hypothetical protein